MDEIDIALASLADPTRRQVVELLIERPRRTNELAEAIGVSVPAVSRHLRVLRERELVDRVDVPGDGRGRLYTLNPPRLETLASWLGSNHWTKKLSATATDPDHSVFLGRVGGFLDAFANADGYVEVPNVDPVVENLEAMVALRSYQANAQAAEIGKSMIQTAIELIA